MKTYRITSLTAVALFAGIASAQGFFDTFDSIHPDWTTDRYDPAGFSVENFDGDNRLRIDISTADSQQNRPSSFSSLFYNTQGKQRDTTLNAGWIVCGDLYISDAFLSTTAGDPLMRTDLWTRDSAPEATANYPIFGVIRNDNADPFNPNASAISTRYRIWDSQVGWVTLGDAVTAGWHNLMIVSTGSAFEYYLDGGIVHTDNTYSDAGQEALSRVFVQAYNFGVNDANFGTHPGHDYHVYWDNVYAAPVPEPATMAVLGLGAAALIRRRKMRS